MDIDGYRIEEDESFSTGKQYFIYKGDDMVGWARMYLGVLSVAASYPPDDLLVCKPFGETVSNFFSSLKDYRRAMRIAVLALEDFYNDHPDSKKNILAILGPVKEVPLSQAPLFALDASTKL